MKQRKRVVGVFYAVAVVVITLVTMTAFQNCGDVRIQKASMQPIPEVEPNSGPSPVILPLKLTLNLLAGHTGGQGNVDGQGSAARFKNPIGLAVDADGNIFVADNQNHIIRKITSGGSVTTIAGLAGIKGQTDGLGSVARFYNPTAVTVDKDGNVFVADSGNSTIRKIDKISGLVSTFAGIAGTSGSLNGPRLEATFNTLSGITVDTAGNVFVTEFYKHAIRKIDSSSGLVSLFAGSAENPGFSGGLRLDARFKDPSALAADQDNNIYVADKSNNAIRKIDFNTGSVSYLGGLSRLPGNNDGPGFASGIITFNAPNGVFVGKDKNIYVADSGNHTIRKITASSGDVETIAGTAGYVGSADGPGLAARFNNPYGITVDADGNIYVTDSGNHTIRAINSNADVSTFAGLVGFSGYSGSVDGTGQAARFNYPNGIAVDTDGAIIVADSNNHTIRKIDSSGVVITVAGSMGSHNSVNGRGSAARFYFPSGLAVDKDGNVFVTDSGNQTIRKIDKSGMVTTFAGIAGTPGSANGSRLAATFFYPNSLALDKSGNIFVSDSSHTIRKIDSITGMVSTFAGTAGSRGSVGGAGQAARFNYPSGIVTDKDDTIFVADAGNHTIRKITSNGVVSTFAGLTGSTGSEDGQGNVARFNNPNGLSIDAEGNIYVADVGNHTIRKITPSGMVSTIVGRAGKAKIAINEELPALLSSPLGVAVTDHFVFITNINSIVVAPQHK